MQSVTFLDFRREPVSRATQIFATVQICNDLERMVSIAWGLK